MLHNERYTDQLGRSWLPKDGDANVGWTDEGAQQDGGGFAKFDTVPVALA